ncbi:cytochrome P450 [Dacryopinax primogenitus]|uniref:Cytochrome P450 n=1 Tax=Dacryopinax primogenitus (strain DJM 731) TaxID=1858805 RepID=M5FY92_DACPD|nr:cytochrome P450 [Dacryopinax primogenitus]EJU03026.1 cytochrome P450 [Dacryopinax primogenitus]
MSALFNMRFLDIAALGIVAWLVVVIYRRVLVKGRMTRLRGPPRKSWILGYNRELMVTTSGPWFEKWAKEYGACFMLPSELGTHRLILTDPRAIAHVLTTNSYHYRRPEGLRLATKKLLGEGILSAEGDDHKRLRKALNPGFTPQALKQFVPTFYDSAHKVEEAWNSLLADHKDPEAIIDVQHWMNSITLDTIGLTGFSYDFGTLRGERPPVVDVLATFGTKKVDFLSALTFLLIQTVPQVLNIPSPRNKLFTALNDSMSDVVRKVLAKVKEEKLETHDHFSMLGPLLKSEGRTITDVELSAQMNTLILAGYETTASTLFFLSLYFSGSNALNLDSLSWCLHELSMRPELQRRMREELSQFPDPTYDQLLHQMHLLEAVCRETLRTHAPVPDHARYAVEDDIIPLYESVITKDGDVVDSIEITAGQSLTIGIEAVNTSVHIWGSTAHEFDPDRWLKGNLPVLAEEIQGYHHLLTFTDGPRYCIGKQFAVLEFKAVLAVLMRKFAFEPSDHTGQNVKAHRGFLRRPQTIGQELGSLMMRVRQVEA